MVQSIRCVTEKKEGNDVLQVFLEPADWNEETQGPTPIVQLDVTVVNYAGDTEVRGSTAVARSDLPCMFINRLFLSCLVLTILASNTQGQFYTLYPLLRSHSARFAGI